MAKSLASTMKKLKSQQVSQVEEQAKKNTTVTKRANKQDTVLKEGTLIDHAVKHDVQSATNSKFGMSLGLTKNMDNYESLRADVWATDDVQDGETLEEAYTRLHATLGKVLEDIVAEYI